MNELYCHLDLLKEELDQLPIFDEIDNLIEAIKKNKELLEKIKKYQEYPSEQLRMDIYSYKEIQKYKQKETDVNLLILSINKRIKENLFERKTCIRENN